MRSEVQLRQWGNSIGIVLPKDKIRKENLRINDKVEITIKRKVSPLRDLYGSAKPFKKKTTKTTDKILDEIDKELQSKEG